MTYLAAPIASRTTQIGRSQLQQAFSLGADLVEIRADFLDDASPLAVEELIDYARQIGLKTIVTARDITQGGSKNIDLDRRLDILTSATNAGVDFIDCEFTNYTHRHVRQRIDDALARSPHCRLILSHHDFKKTFADIESLYAEVLSINPQAIPKLIYTARHINDCFQAFDLLHNKEGDLICFAMGPAAMISRLIAKKLGAFLSFASLSGDTATAPGQLTFEEFKGLYRWDSIGPHTSLFGVIGSPVGHSKSPLIYNASFAQAAMDCLYLPLLLEGDWVEFKTFLDACLQREWLGFKGFSVTVPHKENAMEYVHQTGGFVDSLAIEIGAANTLTIALTRASAFNTDYHGALDAIILGLGNDKNKLHQMHVAVIGAGGVARAVIAALIHAGAKVTIFNRTLENARHLAAVFNCHYEPMDNLAAVSDAKLLVNCTTVGMYPEVQNTPVPAELLRPDMLVFDTVYNPRQTMLLREAAAVGAKTLNGLEMFIAQAAAQYKLFTNHAADPGFIRNLLASSE